jgi:hypothetical protein
MSKSNQGAVLRGVLQNVQRVLILPKKLLRVADADAVPVRKKIWPWLVGTALILFMVDVPFRRLDLAGYRLFTPTPERYG